MFKTIQYVKYVNDRYYLVISKDNSYCYSFWYISESDNLELSKKYLSVDKLYMEYALMAEEFAKKWLKHNKEWL